MNRGYTKIILIFSFPFIFFLNNLTCFFQDWTDNPNGQIENESIWNLWIPTQHLFDAGNDKTNAFAEQLIDGREDRCNMLDDVNQYMLH